MSNRLKILCADDDRIVLLTVRRAIERLGHEAVAATNGAEAVACFEKERPDAVLLDAAMPVMDGFRACAEIRRLCGDHWVPIIFLSGASETTDRVRGLEAGGDDYLIKPVDPVLLDAKLRAMQRIAGLQDRLREHAAELARFRERTEEEQNLARHLMARLVRADRLNAGNVRACVIPAVEFSGDVVCAARTPSGILHALLADGTGHGLAAALSVMPAVEAFYDLTEAGFSLESIVQRLNRQVRAMLPLGRFVAATVVAVDEVQRLIRVWNGGNPPAAFVGRDGEIEFCWGSRYPALGIMDDQGFESATEVYHWKDSGEFFMWSDGLNEAENPAGEQLGLSAVLATLGRDARQDRLAALIARVREHVGGEAGQDDVSILRVACGMRGQRLWMPESTAERAAAALPGGRAWLSLRVEGGQVRQVDLLPVLLLWLEELGLDAARRAELGTVIAELLTNAIDHGVLRLDSTLKQESDGFARYLQQRAERLTALGDGGVAVALEVRADETGDVLDVWVRDTGPGFDHGVLATARTALDDTRSNCGRGLALVARLCERLEHHTPGNEVHAVYRLS